MQKLFVCTCLLLLEVFGISGLPFPYDVDGFQPPSHRAVMVSGYYGRPPFRPSGYKPGGAMTAFISGETVATNSYVGEGYNNHAQESEELELPVDENGNKAIPQEVLVKIPQSEVTEALPEDENAKVTTLKPKRIPKRKPQNPKEEDEDDEDDEGTWPFQLGRKGPSYTAFFPVMLGGYRGSKGRDSEGNYPGSATAIANSFSTGKGGVASSHATAYGDPYVSSLLKNGFNFKKKPVANNEEY